MKTIQWLFCLGLLTSPLHAATFVVTNLMDTGLGSFRQAILDANATVGDDAIEFATNGTITLSSALPTLTDNTTITGPGTNLLTVSGSNKFRIFSLGTGTTNIFSGLTIANGFAYGTTTRPGVWLYANASGIANMGYLRMIGCQVRNCTNLWSTGAGIYNDATGTLEMNACVVADCGGSDLVQGGGIYNSGNLRLQDCLIARCFATKTAACGGGIFNNGDLSLTNTIIEKCRSNGSGDGGGIYSWGGTATLHSSIIRRCSGFWGGGILSSGMLIMTNTSVIGNGATDFGGGVLLFGLGTFNGCTLYSNTCNIGGAALVSRGTLELQNCTISQNRITYDPSGSAVSDKIFGNSTVGTTYLNHCTIVSNIAPNGNINVFGSFLATNSILGDCKGTLQSGGFNLIANTNGCTVAGNTNGNILNLGPQLGPLQNNGGPTWTHAPRSSSPAIDQATAGGLLTDQTGNTRTFDEPFIPNALDGSDIGAFEVAPVLPPFLQITATTTNTVVISWASPSAGFGLEQSSALAPGWLEIGGSPSDDGTTKSIVLPATAGNQFFRLRKL